MNDDFWLICFYAVLVLGFIAVELILISHI